MGRNYEVRVSKDRVKPLKVEMYWNKTEMLIMPQNSQRGLYLGV
jgi:hypothetical protein